MTLNQSQINALARAATALARHGESQLSRTLLEIAAMTIEELPKRGAPTTNKCLEPLSGQLDHYSLQPKIDGNWFCWLPYGHAGNCKFSRFGLEPK